MKPYTSTLDSILDFSLLLGDIAAYTVMRPIHRVQEWWDSDETLWQLFSWRGVSDSIEQTQIPNIAEITATAARALEAPSPAAERSASPPLPSSPGRNPFYVQPEQANGLKPPFSQPVQPLDGAQMPESWYPPPPAYHDIASGENGLQPDQRQQDKSRSPSPGGDVIPAANNVWSTADGSTSQPPVASSSSTSPGMPEPVMVDPWRLYEPFPAAYPPTPLPASPSILPAFRPQTTPGAVPSIKEEVEEPIERPATAPSLSDRKPSPIPQERSGDEEESESEEDTVEEEEEDSFNVTLRTPNVPLPQRMTTLNVSSSSAQSRSTALTTVHQESLRTSVETETDSDSDSDSSSSSASTSSSSISGSRHRRSSSGTSYDVRTQLPAYERIWVGNTVVGVRPRQVTPPQLPASLMPGRPPVRTELDTDSSDESEIEDDRMIPGIKRPRVPKMVSASDSAARMATHARNGSLGVRSASAGSATRPQPPRPMAPRSSSSQSSRASGGSGRNNASSASSSYYYSSASAQTSHAPRRPVRS
jgi:hypothetical protein